VQSQKLSHTITFSDLFISNFNLKPELYSFLFKTIGRVSQNQLCNYGQVSSPFVPSIDNECGRNNESLRARIILCLDFVDLSQRANRTDFFWFEFGSVRLFFLKAGLSSVRFDFIFEKPVRVRFGSSEFSKSRFEFGSVRFRSLIPSN